MVKDNGLESTEGYTINKDTGFLVFDAFKWVQQFYETENVSCLSTLLTTAFNSRLLIQVADYGMPNGYRDVSNFLTFTKNMGFTAKPIYPFSKAFSPWQNSIVLSLVSWEPGVNVDPFGNWCDWAKNSKGKDRPERVDREYWAAYKYDCNDWIDEHPEWDGWSTDGLPERKKWREVRDTKGLYQFEEGRKLEYQELSGFWYGDKLVDQNVTFMTEAPETMPSSVEKKVTRRRGKKRKREN
jgi:hypothetical protein